MFAGEPFKIIVKELVDLSNAVRAESSKDGTLSSKWDSKVKCYVFNNRDTISVIVGLKDDDTTEVKFRYEVSTNKMDIRFESPTKYREELELIYMDELEAVLAEGKKKLGSAQKAYNTQIERVYQQVVKARELREKRKTTCYIK